MESKKLIRLVKERLKILSMSQLATELGYRSQNTVALWLKNKRIPRTAEARVSEYFRRIEKGEKNGRQ